MPDKTHIKLISFGFKHFDPIRDSQTELDISRCIVDVRGMENPYNHRHLRNLTGLDEEVQDFVQKDVTFASRGYDILVAMRRSEFIGYNTCLVGCQGGRHRSVAMVEIMVKKNIIDEYDVEIIHRNLTDKEIKLIRNRGELAMYRVNFARPDITEEEIKAVREVMESGLLAGGPRVQEFEYKMADAFGARYAVAVNSCTQGYKLVFSHLKREYNVKRAIGPVYTFTGPSMMAHQLGLEVQGLDNDRWQYTPDYTSLGFQVPEAGSDTVLMPVHFAGFAADIPTLTKRFPEAHVVDDAAHVFDSRRGDYRVGAWNKTRATIFSFHATKPICTGHGGMILTPDKDMAERLRKDRLHGIEKSSTPKIPAWNYRVMSEGWKDNMTEMAAAMGIVQLYRAMEMQDRRTEIAGKYNRAFMDLERISIPISRDQATGKEHLEVSSWHLYPVRLGTERLCYGLMRHLKAKGIETSVHFRPLHEHKVWGRILGFRDFPNALDVFLRTVSLPIYSSMSDDDVNLVIDSVAEFMQKKAPMFALGEGVWYDS